MKYIETAEQLQAALPVLDALPRIVVDTETTGLDPFTESLLLVQVGDESEQFVIDARKVDLAPLKPILEDPKKPKVLHNAKFDYKMLSHLTGIRLANVADTMLTEMVLENGRLRKGFGLAAVYQHYTGKRISKAMQTSFIGHTGDFSEAQLKYAAADCILPIQILRRQLTKAKQRDLLHTVKLESAAVVAIAQMELNGFLVDQVKWRELVVYADAEATRIRDEELLPLLKPYLERNMEQSFVAIAEDMNIDSDSQMLAALQFIGIPISSTGKVEIAHMGDEYPAIASLLAYRAQRKVVSTYGESFLSHVYPHDGRIHCDFRQLGAESGRLSCTKPNLQNIPANSDFRSCFVAGEGNVLVTADYSGCELRILAELSQDKAFLTAFRKGEDLHSFVAQMLYDKPVSKDVNPDLRNAAKNLNFGLAYGMGPAKLAHALRINEPAARALMDQFFETFPGVTSYLENASKSAVQKGHARTIGGRIRYFDMEKAAGDRAEQGKIERKGKNTPIQGTNADMTKLALFRLHQALPEGTMLVNTVHDEIVVECSEGDAEATKELILATMKSAGEFYLKTVPVESEANIGPCWSK